MRYCSNTTSSASSKKTKSLTHYCLWLLITIVLQILILFFLLRSSYQHQQHADAALYHPDCQSGYVYVYDLPPKFNSEFIDKCHELDPWKSRCSSVSNGGFGPRAAGLERVVPENLSQAWYWTDMYAADVIYHNRVLNHKCRTLDLYKATGFYVPFYAGLAVGKFLFHNYTAKDRDQHSEMLLDWLSEQPSFARAKGADHFIMLGRSTWDFRRLSDKDSEWGSSLLGMPSMKNVFRLSVEKHLNDDVEESVPYPTSFHPRSQSDIVQWQNHIRSSKRTKLFSFVGGRRENIKNDFRGVLMDYCKSEESSCRAVDCASSSCSDGSPAVMETFLDSVFCLQPRGNGLTRRSIFDCMLAGSIPVYFWKGTFKGQYEWHLPWMPQSYTVFIDKEDVKDTNGTLIRKVLEGIHKDKVKEMRETLINLLPKLIYASSAEGLGTVKDAFDIAIERVLKRLKIGRNSILFQS